MDQRSRLGKKALVFVGAFLLGGTTISAGASMVSDRDTFQAAQPGNRTYTLIDLRIEHPFQESAELAGVGYTAQWSTDDYPGVARCRITLTDERGAVVGQGDFMLDSASAEFTRPVGEIVEVSSAPTDGRAQCAQGNYNPDSSRARFEPRSTSSTSNPYLPEEGKGRIKVKFDVDWPGEGGQFMRTCQVVVKFKDGTEAGGEPFTTNMGEGPAQYEVYGEGKDEDDIESANLVCDELGK